MRLIQRISRVAAFLAVVALPSAVALAQSKVEGGPLTGPPVLNAPFSAEATTTIRQTLKDGTRIERRGTARYYRDSAGRVRVEQTIVDPENPAAPPKVRVTIHADPVRQIVHTLDPAGRKATAALRFAAGLAVGGGDTFAVPLGGPRFLIFNVGRRARGDLEFDDESHEESLGTRLIQGVETSGRRITFSVPAGRIGNDRPLQFVDERWESAELKLVIYARSSDPRTGVVEYQLTNIRRTEPSAGLFSMPSDHTIELARTDIWIALENANSPNRRTRGARFLRHP